LEEPFHFERSLRVAKSSPPHRDAWILDDSKVWVLVGLSPEVGVGSVIDPRDLTHLFPLRGLLAAVDKDVCAVMLRQIPAAEREDFLDSVRAVAGPLPTSSQHLLVRDGGEFPALDGGTRTPPLEELVPGARRLPERVAEAEDLGTAVIDCGILAVKRGRNGRRYTHSEHALNEYQYEEFPDFKVPGPRSSSWVLDEMCQGNRNPAMAFIVYRTDLLARLKQQDVTAVMQSPLQDSLEFTHELLEVMITWDQLQVLKLVAGEFFCRRIRQIKTTMRSDPKAMRLELDIDVLGTGDGRRSDVAPELNDWIADWLKSRRKIATEQRMLKGGGGKGQG